MPNTSKLVIWIEFAIAALIISIVMVIAGFSFRAYLLRSKIDQGLSQTTDSMARDFYKFYRKYRKLPNSKTCRYANCRDVGLPIVAPSKYIRSITLHPKLQDTLLLTLNSQAMGFNNRNWQLHLNYRYDRDDRKVCFSCKRYLGKDSNSKVPKSFVPAICQEDTRDYRANKR